MTLRASYRAPSRPGNSAISFIRSSIVTSERTQKLAATNYWNELMALRDRQREARKTAVQVVRLSELPLENNQQGLMRWYLHPAITDTILSTLAIYRQEMPPGSRSGRLKFQGGQIMFIVEGRGHTTARRRQARLGSRRRAQPADPARRHHRAAFQRRSRTSRRRFSRSSPICSRPPASIAAAASS